MSLVVNCLGGPGVGKSAFAARIFAELKHLGAKCELVTEYPKDLVWEENGRAIRDQLYVFANQAYRQELLRDRAEIIITDSPLVLSAVYNADLTSDTFKQLVLERFCSFPNLNYLILRSSRFDPVGRIHNLEESKRLDRAIEEYLGLNQIKYNRVWLEDTCLEIIIEEILLQAKAPKNNQLVRAVV